MNDVSHVALLTAFNLTPAELSFRARIFASARVEVAVGARIQEGFSCPFSGTEARNHDRARTHGVWYR